MNKHSKEFTWGDLGKGLIGSVIGGAIEGVGIGISTLINTPRVTLNSLKGLWRTKTLGPVLKTTVTPPVIVSGIIAPAVGVLGGMICGICEGFVEGVKENPFNVPTIAAKTIRKFNIEIVDEALKNITEISMKKYDKFYEIRIIEATRGLICGIPGGIVTGVGIFLSTLFNFPFMFLKCSNLLWTGGGIILPFTVGMQILLTVVLVLSIPLSLPLGILSGLGLGAYRGYSKGILFALKKSLDDVYSYHDALYKIHSKI